MRFTIYPTGHPRYREPLDRLLSPTELRAAHEEFDYRKSETLWYYRRAVSGGNVERAREMSTALKLLERERERFFGSQEEHGHAFRLAA